MVLIAIVVWGIHALLLASHQLELPGVVHVQPPSLPAGLYLTRVSDTARRGDAVLLCLPAHVFQLGRTRGYLPRRRGSQRCPARGTEVVKMVAGLPGDTVHVASDSIRLAQGVVLYAPVFPKDSRGRPLGNAIGTHILGEEECFLLSTYSERSFDSRYFGPVPCAPPYRVATPMSAAAQDTLRALASAWQPSMLRRDLSGGTTAEHSLPSSGDGAVRAQQETP